MIHLAKNKVNHSCTMHVDVRYHIVGDVVEDGDISLLNVHTNDNPANMFTKVVTGSKVTTLLGLV